MSDGAAGGEAAAAGGSAPAAGGDAAAPTPVAPAAGTGADASTPAITNGSAPEAAAADAGAADGKAAGEGAAGDGKGTSMQAQDASKEEKKKKKKDGADDDEDSGEEVQPKKTFKQRFCPCLPQRGDPYANMRNLGGGGDDEAIMRPFEFSFALTGVFNVLNDPVDAFFSVGITAINPLKHKNKVKMLREFTVANHFKGGEDWKPPMPIPIYSRERFFLSYKELRKHQLQLDMWEVSKLSFNKYHGWAKRDLWRAGTMDAFQNFFVKKRKTPKEEAKKKKAGGDEMDVALFRADCRIEEVFDFKLACENFSLEYDLDNPKARHWNKEQARLQFIMPKNPKSFAHRARTCHKQVWPTWQGPERYLWSKPIFFIFTGTRQQLSSSFFIVNVYTGKPKFANQPPTNQIGKALMGLTSILDISVFKGTVKHLSTKKSEFLVGKLNGNIRLEMRSLGEAEFHKEEPLNCPVQPRAATNVTHLSKNEQYLVVNVDKCLDLPIADVSQGTSDPYLRVMWDEMVQCSSVVKATVRPVFKQLFFFPVRIFSLKLADRRYMDSAFRYEIETKGPVKISVWDKDNDGSSDLLGVTDVPMFDLIESPLKDFRALRGRIKKKDDGSEEDEFAKPAKKEWYDEEKWTRIFDGISEGGIQLRGKNAANQATPMIYFECYFWPDFDENLSIPENTAAKKMAELWRAKERAYVKEAVDFVNMYKQAFPDSIGALPAKMEDQFGARNENCRRFYGCSMTVGLDQLPLMAWVVKIIVPRKFSTAALLLHWMNCFTFHMNSQQTRSGLVHSINDPQNLLFSRKGSVQDHACLLCSILRGTSRDAFVVKGTVQCIDEDPVQKSKKKHGKHTNQEEVRHRLVEHYWVMTREPNDWITFWDPCTRDVYHMPGRYSYSKANARREKAKEKRDRKARGEKEVEGAIEAADGKDEKAEEDLVEVDDKEVWQYEVPDYNLNEDDIEQLPTIGRTPKAKAKVNKGPNPRDIAKMKLMQQRERLIIAPKISLLAEDKLVDWLPYDSIEFVFNEENVWSNRQNHHPACITYDLDEPENRWSKMLKNEKEQKELKIDYITKDVVQDPPMTPAMIKKATDKTIQEMKENMKLYRRNRGCDCEFDNDRRMPAYCRAYLTILEDMRRLDRDFCPIWQKHESEWNKAEKYLFKLLDEKRSFNRHGSAFECNDAYVGQQEDDWQELMFKVEEFIEDADFPSRRGKQFDGFAIHFCTNDPELMRKYLMSLDDYKELIECDDADDLNFFIHCEMRAMLNGIASVWLYFGKHCPVDAIKKKKKKAAPKKSSI